MPALLDGPLFSILLCLLAGIALRYAIYHAQDDADEGEAARQRALEQAREEFRERHWALQQALETALQNETQLRVSMARVLAESDSLRTPTANHPEGVDTASTNPAESSQRIRDLEQELARQETLVRELRLQKEEILTHLERERNVRQEMAHPSSHTVPYAVAREDEGASVTQCSLRALRHHQRPTVPLEDVPEPSSLPRILSFSEVTEPTSIADPCVVDPARGLVYDRPPLIRDDLRRISGIGEILAARLNSLGVYTFKQIMQWESSHVREYSRLLSFRDRIERDQWVAQARRLHLESRGEAA